MSRGAPEHAGDHRLTETLTRVLGHSANCRAGIWQLNGVGEWSKGNKYYIIQVPLLIDLQSISKITHMVNG